MKALAAQRLKERAAVIANEPQNAPLGNPEDNVSTKQQLRWIGLQL